MGDGLSAYGLERVRATGVDNAAPPPSALSVLLGLDYEMKRPSRRVGVMTEITRAVDMTGRSEDGWSWTYFVTRDDGGEVVVEASCTGTAEAMARGERGDRAGLAAIEDRCSRAAVDFAERAQSPLRRGSPVLIRLSFDSVDGGALRHDYVYPDSSG